MREIFFSFKGRRLIWEQELICRGKVNLPRSGDDQRATRQREQPIPLPDASPIVNTLPKRILEFSWSRQQLSALRRAVRLGRLSVGSE